jgi:hypothetical protein
MYAMNKPTPQQVRDWMKQRQINHRALPTPEEIRRQLGWNLINKGAECAR